MLECQWLIWFGLVNEHARTASVGSRLAGA